MTVAELPALRTTEEMLALPDNKVERWLIRGQLREKPDFVNFRQELTAEPHLPGFRVPVARLFT